MHFCTVISRTALQPRSLPRSAARSMASSPPRAPSVHSSPEFNRTKEMKRLDNHSYKESTYKLGKHRSNAMEMVHKVPIIEVEGEMAVCDGGGGALGHPLEYISLARPGAVEYCKYCALRYTKKRRRHKE